MTNNSELPVRLPTLSWGIRTSFMRYLHAIEDFKMGAADGASINDSADEFSFPGSTQTELANGGVRLEFSGELRLQAHGGMLQVILMNPWLSFTPNGVELSVVDLMAWPDTSRRETIAVSPAEVAAVPLPREIELVLTATGAETFNNVYLEGTPMLPAKLTGS